MQGHKAVTWLVLSVWLLAASYVCSAARVVLLWPEEGGMFRYGKGIIAALVTSNFDPPREGSIELLLNGVNKANFTPEAQDGEGNRRLHVVLPELPDGTFSVEIRCLNVEGALLARAGATFEVNSSAPARNSSAASLEQPSACHPVGFCDADAECSGHGACSKGACVCYGDWTGETCSHDVLTNPSFLPDADPGRSPALCHRAMVSEAAAKLVLDHLLSLHALQHCVEEDNVVWVAAPHHGLGGNMHILSVALTHAYILGKALGIAGEWTYGVHESCSARAGGAWGLACYFEPHSRDCSHLISPEKPEGVRVLREEEPEWMWQRRDELAGTGQCSHYHENVADNPPWRLRQQGVLWWRAQLLSYIYIYIYIDR